MNIASRSLAAASTPDAEKAALRFFDHDFVDRSWSYAELAEASLRVAGGLVDAGVGRGDRVMVRLPSGLEFAAAVLGSLAAGAVAVPSTDRLTPEEASFLAADAGVRALVSAEGIALPSALPDGSVALDVAALVAGPSRLAAPVAVSAEDPALLVYTSGTTSRPKGVLHAHRMASGREPMRDGWTGIGPTDVVLHAGKLNWTYAFGMILIDTLSAGATGVLYEGPNDPHVWPKLVRLTGATVFAAVPSLFRQILKYDIGPDDDLAGDLRTLRHGLCAGEPLSPALYRAWRDRVGTELYEALGMTECSTYVSSGPETPVREGSPGRPQPGRRVAILDVDPAAGDEPLEAEEAGLLAVHRSDPGLMLGYWGRPDEEARVYRGEWFVGGDLARMDSDGYVWFEGRNDDLMNAFGYRVSPVEVEEALAGLPGVAECAVAERQVRADVRVVCAYVVRAPGAELTRDAVLAWCAGRLADYKRPREVVFCDALPRGPNGKLLRRRLASVARSAVVAPPEGSAPAGGAPSEPGTPDGSPTSPAVS